MQDKGSFIRISLQSPAGTKIRHIEAREVFPEKFRILDI